MAHSSSTILVTGGAGFIGSHLVDHLLGAGHRVRVIDNFVNGKRAYLSDAQAHERFELIEGDIRSASDCAKAMAGVSIVFHLACLGVRHSLHSPFENHDVNATGTLRVLEAARAEGIERFIYVSSSEVYGKVDSFPISEAFAPKPITVYGSSKLAGEHYTHSFFECFGMNTVVFRIFNNYGPRAHYEGDAGEIIPRTIVKALYGQPPVVFGDGSITRDFFYVKDTARILYEMMHVTELVGGTFNLGTGVEITMRALVEKLLEWVPEFKGSINYLPDRPADVPRLWVNSDKLKKVKHYQSDFSFDEGLNHTVAYYRSLVQNRNLLADMEDFNWKKA